MSAMPEPIEISRQKLFMLVNNDKGTGKYISSMLFGNEVNF